MNKRTILGILLSIAVIPFAVQAEISTDVHIQSDTDPVRLDIDRRTFEEIKSLLNQGYPTVSVMLHIVSLGTSINDVVYLAVKADPSRAQEFYDTAVSLLPLLPGWTIQDVDSADRYYITYLAGDLGALSTVAEVARRFFDEDQRISPFPKWNQGEFHIMATTAELAGLISDEFWYQKGTLQPGSPRDASNRPIFISFYRDQNEIVIDSGVERIRKAQQQGILELPVVFVYNDIRTRPISRYPADVTATEIVNDFFERGLKLTAVPEWQDVGDFHMFGSVQELLGLINARSKNEIDPGRWERITQDIRDNGFQEPLLLSLFNSGDGQVWANEADRLVAAAELGITEIPVVYLYHDLGRPPCGHLIRNTVLICAAAVAGGASPSICQPPPVPGQPYRTSGGGGGGSPLPTPTPPPTTPPPTTTPPPPPSPVRP